MAFEEPFLRTLVKLGEHPLEEERLRVIDEGIEQLEIARTEADFAIYLPLVRWLEALRDNKPFRELLRAKSYG